MASQPLQSTSPNQLQRQLTANDLPQLLNLLQPVAHKCVFIGLQLGVSDDMIQNIRPPYPDCQTWLYEILRHRLNHTPSLTWHDVVKALQSNSVQENRLASEIESWCIHQSPVLTSVQASAPHMPSQTSLQAKLGSQSLGQPLQISSTPPLSRYSVPQPIAQSPHLETSLQPLAHHQHHHNFFPQSPSLPTQPRGGTSLFYSSNLSGMRASHMQSPSSLQETASTAPTGRTNEHLPVQHSGNQYKRPPTGVPSHYQHTTQWCGNESAALATKLGNVDHYPLHYHPTPHYPHPPPQLHPPHQSHSPYHPHPPPQLWPPHQSYPPHYSFDVTSLAATQLHAHQHTHPTHPPLDHEHGSYSDSGTPHPKRVHHSLMTQYVSYVRTIYRSSVVERNPKVTKWPPTPSKIFINLVCIDRKSVVTNQEADEITQCMVCHGSVDDVILKKKRCIDFSDIAKDVPNTTLEKVIIVEGAPGVGKSTFSWEFCRRWERGEIAQQYQLVLLLRLGDERTSKAQSLADLILHSSNHIRLAVLQELESTLGVDTLIILEGFDELPSTCRTRSSVFLQLIHGQLLPLATVLVTSRPWATRDIHRECSHRIFQHIEILGFTNKQIEEYVTSVFTDGGKLFGDRVRENIEEVMSYIRTYPQILSCMYIPLNSAIVVIVYQESKAGKCILPRTLTELYYVLLQTLLLRYLYGHPEYGQRKWKIQSLKEDLPSDVYSKLLAIGELAYSGICTEDGESVQLIYNLPPGFETLGLMQAVPELYVIQGEVMSYNFLHLTVQEFLAALHISNMSPEQQLEYFRRREKKWRVVLSFLEELNKIPKIEQETEADNMIDEEKQKQLLDEALRYGFISTNLDILLFIGAAGTGKSHYKNLCLGLPPPEVRDSTGLSEHPVRTMSRVRGAVKQIPQNGAEPNYQWTEVSDVQLKELIVEAVGEGEVDTISDPAVVMNSDSKVSEGSPTLDSKHDLDNNPEPLSNVQKKDVEHNEPDGLELHVDQRTSENKSITPNEKPTSTRDIGYKSNLYQELLDATKNMKSTPPSQRNQVKLLDVNWVYIVDSGGQPQFREMLPLLVQMATACVLTLKLNEPLGELNEVECIEKGKELCRPYLSVLTNEQTVKHCSQIVDSQAEDCALFIVGTHRDLEHHCETESRADKNKMLRKLLEPQLGDKLEKYTVEEVIYPVNSKDPQEGDEEVVQQFRNALHATWQNSSKEKVKIPLHWFLLDLLLRQLSMKSKKVNDTKDDAKGDTKIDINVEILSFEGCKRTAMDQLKMSEEAFQAALKFLAQNLGTILYFPDIRELKHIIFTPQALMSILSEIVKIHHRLNDYPWPAMYQRQRKMWSTFKMFGMMDKTLLESAPLKAFFSDVFAPEHFLILMRELMIAACVSDTTHFFPSVLEELPPGEVQRKTKESCKCLAPLILHCSSTVVNLITKENWLPVGSFMSLVVQLLNVNKWIICTDDKREPTCLYRNCIQLRLPNNQPGIVTLVNQFSHMEVYLQVDFETIKRISKTVGSTIHAGLVTVCEHLNHSRKNVQMAFLCSECNESHIATLAQSDSGEWMWTCKDNLWKLTEKQWPWVEDTRGGLDIDDLAVLENALISVAAKSKAFGVQLKVKDYKLKAIEKQYNDPYDQLHEILCYRLTQLPLLTWHDIIQALQSESMQENKLASEIESQHPN